MCLGAAVLRGRGTILLFSYQLLRGARLLCIIPLTVFYFSGRRRTRVPYDRVNPDVILAATKKLLGIRNGEAVPDDRDSLANQTFHGPEDFFKERIDKDAGGIGRNILWKSTFKGKLAAVPSGALTPQMESVLMRSGMGAPIEEINPLELMDQNLRVLRLGEGGIPSEQAIPDEARGVHPSQFGYIDPYRGPESSRLGVDTRLAANTYKGSDGQVYTDFRNVKTGKVERVSAPQSAQSTLAFPGEMSKPGNKVRAMVHGKMGYADKSEVDYELPHPTDMFNTSINMVPMVSATQGNRAFVAGKMFNQALPLKEPEAPLVQAETATKDVSFDEELGTQMGAIKADSPGVVVSTRSGKIKVSNHDGSTSEYEMYQSMPMNRKTTLNNTPVVRPGDVVSKGGLLARSNFTDAKGVAASGTNLRVAFLPYKGLTTDDAYVISESAAKKLNSEHLYTPSLELGKKVQHGLHKFVSLFPSKYNRTQLKQFDDDGVIKPGTRISRDDPLILAIGEGQEKGEGQWSQGIRTSKPKSQDRSVTWEHDMEGEVTDVVKGKDGIQVAVRAYAPMQLADKISDRFGGKGVVAKIIPDDKMPRDKAGRPYEVIQNPLTLPTRMNPAQVLEMQLAKIARKTGKPYKVPAFLEGSMVDYVAAELKKHGLEDTEAIYDPEVDREMSKVMTGEKFFMKLHHTAEGKWSARETAGYTSEGVPSSGGGEGAKMITNLGVNALIGHNAWKVLRDTKLVRGQRNEDYWRTFRQGFAPPSPSVPLVYKKFIAQLRAAGINVNKKGSALHIMAMTDKDVDKVSKGEITRPETVTAKDLKPIKGGLFDRAITGGIGGTNWNHISLAEPLPSPVMEEPIRRLLGLTKKDLEAVIAGRKPLHGKTGGSAVREALSRINIDRETAAVTAEMRIAKGSRRDNAIKKLGYLKTAKEYGMHPRDWVVSKVPVLPANYRPISKIKDKTQIVSDANYLYQDLLYNNEALTGLRGELGESGVGDERLNLYKSFKAVAGLGDPVHPKLQEQGVQGMLKHVFGKGSPKRGLYQRRVLGSATDFAARGVITPNPSLDMDQVGLPEEQAWKLYRPFVIRRLVRRGMKSTDAATMVEDQDPKARLELIEEMEDRPIMINRAPTLHRYGMMAAFPKLVKGNTLQVSPITIGGFGGDFDGDQQINSLVINFSRSVIPLIESTMGVDWLKDRDMYSKDLGMSVDDAGMCCVVNLEDFPHLEEYVTKEGKNGRIDFHPVQEGIRVLAYNEKLGQVSWQPVSGWSKHYDRKLVFVNLRSGRQIITDDDPRAVYGISKGELELKRFTPGEAVRSCVLVPRKVSVIPPISDCNSYKVPDDCAAVGHRAHKLYDGIYLDDQFGYLIGAMCGGGWVSKTSYGDRQVNIAGLDNDIFEHLHKCIEAIIDGVVPEPSLTAQGKEDKNRCGYVFRVTYSSAALGRLLEPLIGHLDKNKHLPPFFLSGNESFRYGLLAGLMDTGGTITVVKAKAKKCSQVQANFTTTSIRTAQEAQLLCASLSIKAKITPFVNNHGRSGYCMQLSAVDIKYSCLLEYMKCRYNVDNFSKVKIVDNSTVTMHNDIIPLPKEAGDVLKEILLADGSKRFEDEGTYKAAYTAVCRSLSTGYITRYTAIKCLALVPGRFESWRKIVDNKDVTWDLVESANHTESVETGYDLTVPKFETFMSVDGIILSNTMSYHLPVSEDAVDEAKRKMLPSRNLLSAQTFDVHYTPKQEYLLGLYQASSKKSKRRTTTFATKADAIKAYKRGDIGLGDPVVIKENE